MIEHALGEGLATGGRAQLAVEAEGLHDGQVRLHGEHGRADTLLLREDLSTTLVQHGVDTTDGVLRALDLDCTQGNQSRSGNTQRCPHTEVDGLLKTWRREQASGVGDTTARGDDLSSTTMDGVRVELTGERDKYNTGASDTKPDVQ